MKYVKCSDCKSRNVKFKDITFYNLAVYHYDLHDKQIYIITR